MRGMERRVSSGRRGKWAQDENPQRQRNSDRTKPSMAINGLLPFLLAGVVSVFTEPSIWCVGAVLKVAWCAVCASAAPNSWRIEVVLVVAGVV